MDDQRLRLDGPALLLLLLGALFLAGSLAAPADGRADDADRAETFGRRIVLRGTAGLTFQRNLESLLKECRRSAAEDGAAGSESVLVIEIHTGPSSPGQVLDVAQLLMRPEYARVRTVAWIPKKESVTGNNAIVALACHDILMHPDASLGDIGDGKPAPEYVRNFVKNMVAERRNPHLYRAVARGMLDPQTAVMKVTVVTTKEGKRRQEIQFVDDAEFQALKKAGNVEIPDPPVTLKDAGEIGVFTGRKANDDNFLIVRTAKSLDEVAANYNIPLRSLLKTTVTSGGKMKVALIRVNDDINPLLESFLLRQIDRCEREGYNLLIFEITSTDGLLNTSLGLAGRIAELDPEKTRTVAYVPRQALNGAAIVALACDEVYLLPNATFGSIDPFDGPGDRDRRQRDEDTLDALKNELRTLAENKHRPPALLEAMADRDLKVYRVTHKTDRDRVFYMSARELKAAGGTWVNRGVVPESEQEKLLTLTGKRALELGLADGVVLGKTEKEQMRALKAHLGIPPERVLVPLERTWVDSLVFGLNNPYVTVLLLVVAIVCIYLELQMTTGLLGIVSALCFALFFWSRFLGGTAGWLEVVLFVLGLACIAIEVFVIPGFGVFGVSGGILILSSLVLASQTFGNIEPNADMTLLAQTLGKLAISIVLVVVLAMALSRILPRIPLFNRLVLASSHVENVAALGPQLRPEYVDAGAALVGQRGETVSVLRPAGKAQIDDKLLDVVSDGPYIPAGRDVEVVSVSGNRIVVRAV
ncbi:MAG: NfeD family protein [Planctomycetaceae bacterium]